MGLTAIPPAGLPPHHHNYSNNNNNKGNGNQHHNHNNNNGDPRQDGPPTDPTRPPRLSRRDRGFYCFHFDLSQEGQRLLSSLIRYVHGYGARYSAFLDINVTHVVTDKPLRLVQATALMQKLNCKFMCLSDFLQKIVESYERPCQNELARAPLSPTLRKAALEIHQQPDLSHMLANEHRNILATRGGRAITPLYNAAANAPAAVGMTTAASGASLLRKEPLLESRYLGSVGGKKVVYEVFRYPFILIEEATHTFASVYKEYAPAGEPEVYGFPYLNLKSEPFHCPWATRSHKGQQFQMIEGPKGPVLLPMALDRGRNSIKGSRTLAQHRARFLTEVSNRGPLKLKGLCKAPLPPINTHGTPKAQDKPRPGYCECCYEKYSHMERHVAQQAHRKLVTSSEFYRVVDKVIATLQRPVLSVTVTPFDESQELPTPPSPAKSAIAHQQPRIKSVPLKNITNLLVPSVGSAVPPTKPSVAAAMVMEMGSDTHLGSSPSLKRRRSQRLVGRTNRSVVHVSANALTGKFVL